MAQAQQTSVRIAMEVLRGAGVRFGMGGLGYSGGVGGSIKRVYNVCVGRHWRSRIDK